MAYLAYQSLAPFFSRLVPITCPRLTSSLLRQPKAGIERLRLFPRTGALLVMPHHCRVYGLTYLVRYIVVAFFDIGCAPIMHSIFGQRLHMVLLSSSWADVHCALLSYAVPRPTSHPTPAPHR